MRFPINSTGAWKVWCHAPAFLRHDWCLHRDNRFLKLQEVMDSFYYLFYPPNALLYAANSPNLNSSNVTGHTMPYAGIESLLHNTIHMVIFMQNISIIFRNCKEFHIMRVSIRPCTIVLNFHNFSKIAQKFNENDNIFCHRILHSVKLWQQ